MISQNPGINNKVKVKIKTGLDIKISGAPDGTTVSEKSCDSAAILGRDFHGTRFDVLVQEGDLVKAGETVLCDRRQPKIKFNAPGSGTVTAIRRGARRAVLTVEQQHGVQAGGQS